MSRWSLMGLAIAFAVYAGGCAHCDTCDDIPTSCIDGNCAMSSYAGPQPVVVESDGPVLSPVMTTQPVTAPPPSQAGAAGPLTPPAEVLRSAPFATPPSPITGPPTTTVTPPTRPATPQP